MRTKRVNKTLIVEESVYDRIVEDKEYFEKTIGGGKWSMNDTLTEYFKILNMERKRK